MVTTLEKQERRCAEGEITRADYSYDPDFLVRTVTDHDFNGFAGCRCKKCRLRVNVERLGATWDCPDCGTTNRINIDAAPHARPAVGPTVGQIEKAVAQAAENAQKAGRTI